MALPRQIKGPGAILLQDNVVCTQDVFAKRIDLEMCKISKTRHVGCSQRLANFFHPVGVGHYLRAGLVLCSTLCGKSQLQVQGQSVCIIEIDHHGFGVHFCKERLLGLPIRRHVTVIVQVILREVGENGHFDFCTPQPPFFQSNRGGLQGHVRKAF